MTDGLGLRVLRLKDDFFAAVAQGPAAISAFNARYLDLRCELGAAAEAGTLPDHIRELARTSAACILDQAQFVRGYTAEFDDIARTASNRVHDSADALCQPPSRAASLPLYRYFLANICHPYPDSDEKERLAEAVREAGWRDFERKKLEDWLNRKRNQSGFATVLRNHCDDDREAMRNLCRTVLHGTAEEKARLPASSIDDVEDMLDLVQSQYDDLAGAKESTWVESLASGVHAILGEVSAVAGDPSCDLYQEEEEGVDADHDDDDDDDEYDDGDDDDDDYSDSDSDSDSAWSDTDVENDGDNDDGPPCSIIGAKRKLRDSLELSTPVAIRPLPRSPSMSSSTGSSSSSTACSLRSFSGSTAFSVTSVDWEDEDGMCDRPTKRSRSQSSNSDAEPTLSTGPPKVACVTTALPNSALFTTYQTKRRRGGGGLISCGRSIKRSRYASLGVSSQTSAISDAHLSSISGLCNVAWTLGEAVLSDLDVNAFTVDSTQSDEESELDDYTIFGECEDDEPAEGVPAWSKLQIHTILGMVLAASDRSLPVSLAQSAAYAYAFDIDTLGTYNATDLEEMMKLTPEALSAMFDAMNQLAPASVPVKETLVPAAETVAFTEGTALPSSEDELLSLEAPSPTRDVSATALDVSAPALTIPSPVLDAPMLALDAPVAAVETSGLSIDTSSVALETPASATDEPPSPTSSSSSEGDSPPALSDDSGSSSRSSSVESDSEQDSLLLSPAALSADYCQTNDELSVGKALSVDASQFQVEFGALPEVTTADELSCASELLERYLNDQMTWS